MGIKLKKTNKDNTKKLVPPRPVQKNPVTKKTEEKSKSSKNRFLSK